MDDFVLTDDQKNALDEIVTWGNDPSDLAISLSGSAGVGKSVLTGKIKQFMTGDIAWAAMTGRAALRLSEVAGIEAKTLHSTLYMPPLGRGRNGSVSFTKLREPSCDLLIVDEVSMMGAKIYEDLKIWMNKGVKVLFIGDYFQLPPVMAPWEEQKYGSDFMVFNEVKGPVLSQVMRSCGDIIDIANRIRVENRIPTNGNNSVQIIRNHPLPGAKAIKGYLENKEDHALITWTNKLRMAGNLEIRKRLGHTSTLPDPDEPILIKKNGQERLNGEIVYAAKFTEGPKILSVKTHWMHLDDESEILVSTTGKEQHMDGSLPDIPNWRDFSVTRNKLGVPEPLPITPGYVNTVHGYQGSQIGRVSIYLSASDIFNPHFNKLTKLSNGSTASFAVRFLYTAISRAKRQVSLIMG